MCINFVCKRNAIGRIKVLTELKLPFKPKQNFRENSKQNYVIMRICNRTIIIMTFLTMTVITFPMTSYFYQMNRTNFNISKT
jgi:hypothetical protein